MSQPGVYPYASCIPQGFLRGHPPVGEPVCRVKTAYVPGGILAKFLRQEQGQLRQRSRFVIQPRNNQGGHFNHYPGPLHPDERLFHRLQPGAALFFIERIIKGLEVNISGIQKWCYHIKGLFGHIPVGYKNIVDPALFCQAGGVIGKFKIDGRFRVGIGDTFTARLFCLGNDLPWRRGPTPYQTGPVCGHLGNVGVLTEVAFEITPDRGNRIRPASRAEMKKRLFLNRVDVPCDELAVNHCMQDPRPVFPHMAKALFIRFDDAPVAAQTAPDSLFVKRFPQKCFHGRSPIAAKWFRVQRFAFKANPGTLNL